jgi:hypothetical protein
VAAWLTLPFGAWDHWYREPVVLVETVPAGSELVLFYVRANFQELSEAARAPVRVRLPNRIDSTSRDVLSVRAVAAGHVSTLQSFRVHGIPDKVVVRVQPLENALVALGHLHLAGRTTLWLRTLETPELRVSRPDDGRRFTLSLHRTASRLATETAIETPIVAAVQVRQVGEDLVVGVQTREPAIEVRSRLESDPVRRDHLIVLDLAPEGSRLPSDQQVRSEIEAARFDLADPCIRAFERALAEGLDPAEVARAHRTVGTLVELYQRESMLRLGRLSGGRVRRRSGESFRTGHPLELALALEAPAEIEGYLGLLGAVARETPDPTGFLRALLASDSSAAQFASIHARAEAARAECP